MQKMTTKTVKYKEWTFEVEHGRTKEIYDKVEFISNDNSIQGVICDFSEMEYTFGNRLAKIFVGELDLVSRLCEALRCQILRR